MQDKELYQHLLGLTSPWTVSEHGVKTVTVPWALLHGRFTIMFEGFAIEVLQMTQAVKGAMSILRLQWDATWHIIERAVARGKARKEPSLIPRIGMANVAADKVRRGEHIATSKTSKPQSCFTAAD